MDPRKRRKHLPRHRGEDKIIEVQIFAESKWKMPTSALDWRPFSILFRRRNARANNCTTSPGLIVAPTPSVNIWLDPVICSVEATTSNAICCCWWRLIFFFFTQNIWKRILTVALLLTLKSMFVLTGLWCKGWGGLKLFPNGAFGCFASPCISRRRPCIWNKRYTIVNMNWF